MTNHKRQNGLVRAVKKFLLSAFVVIGFGAYALENRVTAGGAMPSGSGATTTAAGTRAGAIVSSAPAAPTARAAASSAPAAPTAGPTATATAAVASSSGYKDGTFTGSTVDVNWGYVQVEATIQSGKISDVRFLQYPRDRRTSVRINSVANPELQQESIQAQSANVNIITGATLTSEGFQESLQSALDQAKS